MPPRKTIARSKAPSQTQEQPARLTRQFQLNATQRRDFSRSELIENYIDLLLDLTQKHSYTEMAEILGVNERFLTDTLNYADDFRERYEKRLEALRSGTRVGTARAKIEDLALDAAHVLERIMNDPAASAKVRQEAAVAILDRAGINGKDIPKHGRGDNLREFLEHITGGTVNLTQINMNLNQIITSSTPTEYVEALREIAAETPQIAPATEVTPEIVEYNSGTDSPE